MPAPALPEVIAALDALWPRERSEEWDAVGPVCGDVGNPEARVDRVLFAVDPVQEIADEAVSLGAQLLVTHHPLYLRGTTTVSADTFKGRVVHTLIRHGVALHVAHTNADSADPGVSDALAGALDLRVTAPLVPDATDPEGRRGLGRICELPRPMRLQEFAAWAAKRLPVTAQGVRAAGDPKQVIRTVAVCGGSGDSLFGAVRAAGVDAYLTADLRHHPASEAREHGRTGSTGTGPMGRAGDTDRTGRTGRTGTADRPQAPLVLLDAAHFATEWPWCEQAAAQLDEISDRHGWGLRTHVSRTVTDPWTAHAPSAPHGVGGVPDDVPADAPDLRTDTTTTPGAPN